MFVLANGDCIEVGMMQNPKTGKVEMYKEYWTSPNVTGKLQLGPCVVAKAMPPQNNYETEQTPSQNGSGGLIIRIGNYCQGIMLQQSGGHKGRPMVADTVLVERWTRGLVHAGENSSTSATQEQYSTATSSGWDQDWRGNTPSDTGISMPCMWVLDDARKVGDEIVVKGTTWTIVEASSVTDEDL